MSSEHVYIPITQSWPGGGQEREGERMVRGGKKEVQNAEANPDAEERKERKKKAFSKGILSEAPAKSLTVLSPSKTLLKHHGKDILRKSQRKNRFLFSFPGLLAPISGGKIGELKDLGTKNPILYLDFPQGQMKLFGTIVYPKNRYLTLQFSRGGKSVICEDYFDTMIVFSDAWWIGKREDNPEEARIEFPKELHEAQNTEYDFKCGAGAAEMKQGFNKYGLEYVEQESPKTDLEDDPSDGQNKFEDLSEVTPSRHSERTAGKRFNFAEVSSGEDFVGDDVNISEEDEKKDIMEHLTRGYAPGKTKISRPVIFDINNEDGAGRTSPSEQIQQSAISVTKSKELSHSTHSSLVQTTISTMFKKVEEKKTPRNLRSPPSSKDSSEDLQHVGSVKMTNKVKDKGPRKKQKVIDRKAGSENVADKQLKKSNSVEPAKVYKRKTKDFTPSTSTPAGGKKSQVPASKLAVAITSSQVEDDDIEEFSSTSKDSDGSDEDWAAA